MKKMGVQESGRVNLVVVVSCVHKDKIVEDMAKGCRSCFQFTTIPFT
jgi:hypothetical protein